jgi:hypothetical protein
MHSSAMVRRRPCDQGRSLYSTVLSYHVESSALSPRRARARGPMANHTKLHTNFALLCPVRPAADSDSPRDSQSIGEIGLVQTTAGSESCEPHDYDADAKARTRSRERADRSEEAASQCTQQQRRSRERPGSTLSKHPPAGEARSNRAQCAWQTDRERSSAAADARRAAAPAAGCSRRPPQTAYYS